MSAPINPVAATRFGWALLALAALLAAALAFAILAEKGGWGGPMILLASLTATLSVFCAVASVPQPGIVASMVHTVGQVLIAFAQNQDASPGPVSTLPAQEPTAAIAPPLPR